MTGFGAFAGADGRRVERNPSIAYAHAIAAHLADDRRVRALELPVAFKDGRLALRSALTSGRLRAWLGLGVALSRQSVEVEAIALNVAHALGPDEAGELLVHQTLVAGGPTAVCASVSPSAAVDVLRQAAIDAHVSHHAGTFVCNAVAYEAYRSAARRASARGPLAALFVHVPMPADGPEPQVTAALVALARWLAPESRP